MVYKLLLQPLLLEHNVHQLSGHWTQRLMARYEKTFQFIQRLASLDKGLGQLAIAIG